MRHSIEPLMQASGFRPGLRRMAPAEMPEALRRCVLLLGNFDGVHRGHLALIRAGRALALRHGVSLAVMQCDPHPRQFFRGETGFRIACAPVQEALLRRAGVDEIYAPRFDADFAALGAEAFIEDHLLQRLQVSAVVCGEDFRFGRGRAGDVHLLKRMGARAGFDTRVVAPVAGQGEKISSSAVRAAITAGDLAEAEALLGHPFLTCAPGPDGQADALQILPPDGIWRLMPLEGGVLQRVELRGRTIRSEAGPMPSPGRVLAWLPAERNCEE